MHVVIPSAIIVNEPLRPAAANEPIVQYCRVQYMGGEIKCPNPKKLANGQYKDVQIGLLLNDQAKTWRSKDARTGTLIAKEAQFVEVLNATKA
jgi:hypothetical protein